MSHKPRILVVDDEPTARLVAAAALDAIDHELIECPSGEAMLAAASAQAPDVVLLDIEMPGMDGIVACRALREAGHDATQVIFVSAHDDLETRLAAYDAGGDDFIVKPYELSELGRKVANASRLTERGHDLSEQARHAQQAAFAAMTSMAEMGVVFEFLRASHACDTPPALAASVLAALRGFDLDGMVELRPAAGRQCHSSHGECSPLECSILLHASGMERIFQFQDRLAINYPGVTLLAHLPGDVERCGRLRDHLAVIAEAADARLQAMEAARRRGEQSRGIGEAAAEIMRSLDEIDRLRAQHRLRAAEIGEQYLEQLSDAFVHLGLSDGQEAALAGLAQDAHRQLAGLRDEESDIGERLREVARKLGRLA